MAVQILPFFTKPSRGRRGSAERRFLPAALEIVETPASPTVRVTGALVSLFLITAVIWSYFGHVDIVATAPGKVIARARTKIVQPYDSGVVRAIHVTDGDIVVPGQVLIELDPTLPSADKVRFSEMLNRARLDQARLRALLDPVTDAFAGIGAAPDLILAAEARLEAEQSEQAAKIVHLDHEAAGKRAEEAEVVAQIAKIDAALPLVRARADIRYQGLRTEFGSKLDYLQQQQQVVEMEHERVVQQRKHDEVVSALAAVGIERKKIQAEFRRTVLTELAKANQEAEEATGELAKAQQKTELDTLTAPVGGIVQDLAVHTLGGVVTPAQQLLRIVPGDGGIEVQAVVANQDVGFVDVGEEVEIKVETFPFTRYGLIHGHVRALAHDAVDELPSNQRRQGSQSSSDVPENVQRSSQLVYTARIALDDTSLLVEGRSLELAPGMAVTAEIKTGRRRVLDFLLSPFHRYTHDALRER
jgi:hemolysin D